jgi:NADP-dependent 3-hydroxy acid dehydrogenase YdfG
MQASVWLTGLL